jgi:hypothetical protein
MGLRGCFTLSSVAIMLSAIVPLLRGEVGLDRIIITADKIKEMNVRTVVELLNQKKGKGNIETFGGNFINYK